MNVAIPGVPRKIPGQRFHITFRRIDAGNTVYRWALGDCPCRRCAERRRSGKARYPSVAILRDRDARRHEVSP